MSEYWKSTPKYWCKFCKTYVKDTKFEKQQHEATGKHKGNVQRSINQLHRDHAREDREKQRAKEEVARLNAVVSGKPAPPKPPSIHNTAPASIAPQAKKADPEERKRQMNQLAEMGVAVPEEFRGDMALAGEWQTISMKRVQSDEGKDIKPEPVSFGVHKRKLDRDDEDEDETPSHPSRKKVWGSALNARPGADGGNVDFDALMGQVSNAKETVSTHQEENPTSNPSETDVVKKEDPDEHLEPEMAADVGATLDPSPVVFKKRKKTSANTG